MTKLNEYVLRFAYARGFKEGMDAAAKDIDTHLSQQQDDGLVEELRGKFQRAQSTIRAFERVLGFEVDGRCPICDGIEGCSHTLPERIRAASQALQEPNHEQ